MGCASIFLTDIYRSSDIQHACKHIALGSDPAVKSKHIDGLDNGYTHKPMLIFSFYAIKQAGQRRRNGNWLGIGYRGEDIDYPKALIEYLLRTPSR